MTEYPADIIEAAKQAERVLMRAPFPDGGWQAIAKALMVERGKNDLLREALGAFVGGLEGWADENGWTDLACQNDSIRTWIGPGDWLAASKALSLCEPSPADPLKGS